MKTLSLLLVAVILTGCALNRPRLTERTVGTNGVVTEKSMKVTSFVLWPAKESVANQKASITKATMSTGGGALDQDGGGTNMVEALKEVKGILQLVRPTP